MTKPDMVTTNKAQLIAALTACEYNRQTVIEHHRKCGKVTTFKIGREGTRETQQGFEHRLRGFVRNVKRSPAHVWQ